MLQAKFSVKESQARFLNRYKDYGFKDKSTMLRVAIDQFKKTLELEQLNSQRIYTLKFIPKIMI